MDPRVGDVLRISCPFTETLVTGKQKPGREVVLKWPWWSVAPDCEWKPGCPIGCRFVRPTGSPTCRRRTA